MNLKMTKLRRLKNELWELVNNACEQCCIACSAESKGKDVDISSEERYQAYKYLDHIYHEENEELIEKALEEYRWCHPRWN